MRHAKWLPAIFVCAWGFLFVISLLLEEASSDLALSFAVTSFISLICGVASLVTLSIVRKLHG